MTRLTWCLLPIAITSLALVGCGGDAAEMKGVTNAVPGKDYAVSSVCDQLPVDAARALLPGAVLDTSLPSDDSCVYAADHGDLILTVLSAPQGPGTPRPGDLYEMALSDATNNGADDVRGAPSLGDDGKIATNAADSEITAVWRRGDAIYDLQYSGWDGHPEAAIELAKDLARAVRPPT